MNMVIILEILGGIVVLAVAARFAVRDARRRRGVTEEQDTGEVLVRGGEREAQLSPGEPADQADQQDPSEPADQREDEEVAALSAPATVQEGAATAGPEPPADPR